MVIICFAACWLCQSAVPQVVSRGVRGPGPCPGGVHGPGPCPGVFAVPRGVRGVSFCRTAEYAVQRGPVCSWDTGDRHRMNDGPDEDRESDGILWDAYGQADYLLMNAHGRLVE